MAENYIIIDQAVLEKISIVEIGDQAAGFGIQNITRIIILQCVKRKYRHENGPV